MTLFSIKSLIAQSLKNHAGKRIEVTKISHDISRTLYYAKICWTHVSLESLSLQRWIWTTMMIFLILESTSKMPEATIWKLVCIEGNLWRDMWYSCANHHEGCNQVCEEMQYVLKIHTIPQWPSAELTTIMSL